jgi:hypothetical protein
MGRGSPSKAPSSPLSELDSLALQPQPPEVAKSKSGDSQDPISDKFGSFYATTKEEDKNSSDGGLAAAAAAGGLAVAASADEASPMKEEEGDKSSDSGDDLVAISDTLAIGVGAAIVTTTSDLAKAEEGDSGKNDDDDKNEEKKKKDEELKEQPKQQPQQNQGSSAAKKSCIVVLFFLFLAAAIVAGLLLPDYLNDGDKNPSNVTPIPVAPLTCQEATEVEDGTSVTGSTQNANSGRVLPPCSLSPNGFGVWFKLVGDGQVYQANTCDPSTDFDTQITVFEGSCTFLKCNSAASSGDGCGDGQSQVLWSTNPNEEYYIFVHGKREQVGRFLLNVQAVVADNLSCGNASAADSTGLSEIIGNTWDVTQNSNGTEASFSCSNSTIPGLWYAVEGNDSNIAISTCSPATKYNAEISVGEGNGCGDLACVETLAETCLGQQGNIVTFFGVASTTYYFQIHGNPDAVSSAERKRELQSGNPADSQFGLTIQPNVGPNGFLVSPEESCLAAFPLETDGPMATGILYQSSNSLWNPPFCDGGGQGVMYHINGTGRVVMADTCNNATDFDTTLTVLTGNCEAEIFGCIASNDQYCGDQSSVRWTANLGESYYLLVRSAGGVSGNYGITLSNAPTPAPSSLPSEVPTMAPTTSTSPTLVPTASPSISPTLVPTASPSISNAPSPAPSTLPSEVPTAAPTSSANPTLLPTTSPTANPTSVPTVSPTVNPTLVPTDPPTIVPTSVPTVEATTLTPTVNPSLVPTDSSSSAPTSATMAPTKDPTKSPTGNPTERPTSGPTSSPTRSPTGGPTKSPTPSPSTPPTPSPTPVPTKLPTTDSPTTSPGPTDTPSSAPTVSPTASPTYVVDPVAMCSSAIARDALGTIDSVAIPLIGTNLSFKGEFVGSCGSTDPSTYENSPAVWYKLDGSRSGRNIIVESQICNIAFPFLQLTVFRGDCATPICVTGTSDFCNTDVKFEWDNSVSEYYLMFHGFGDSSGNFVFSVDSQ